LTTATDSSPSTRPAGHPLGQGVITFLETGTPPDGVFAPDVFCDFTLPHWRLQAQGIDAMVALRLQGHPAQGNVPRWRSLRTESGFVLEFEESWEDGGQRWYARELALAEVDGGAITSLSVYCTGDWDEALQRRHAESVRLLRP
jgi:hypothetical protein